MDVKLIRFQEMYKRLRFGTSVQSASLSQRVNNLNEHRRNSRNTVMMSKRNINEGTLTPIASPAANEEKKKQAEVHVQEYKKDTRLDMLRKWQSEKQKRLEQQKATRKPLFKVQHVPDTSQFDLEKIYSQIKGKSIRTLKHKFNPPVNIKPISFKDADTAASSSSNAMPKRKAALVPPKRVTRSQKLAVSPALQLPIRTRRAVEKKNGSSKKGDLGKATTKTAAKQQDSEPSTSNNSQRSKTKRNAAENSSLSSEENLAIPLDNRDTNTVPESTVDEVFVPKDVSVQKRRRSRKSRSDLLASSLSSQYPIASDVKTSNGGSSSSPQPVTPLNKCSNSSIYVSPFVTMSRGKENSRKEFHHRSLRGVPEPTDDEVFVPKDISVQKNRRSRKNQPAVIVSTSSSSLSPEYPMITISKVSNGESSSSSQPSTPLNKCPGPSIYVSPFVTMSRGKENARKEFHRRSLRGGTDCEGSRDCTSPKAAAAYFYKLLNKQTDRLRMLCHKWNTYKGEQKPAEEVCDMIDVAVGQTDLLLNKKFQQFKGLVAACETGNSEKPVTCLDLHGFWDMVMIQVENLNKRFENLKKLQENGWEEILPIPKLNQRNKPKKKAVKKSTTSRSSALKAAIQEARRKKIVEVQPSTNEELLLPSTSAETPDMMKSRRSGRNSLRIYTVTSTARRMIGSPGLTMITVTQVAKSAEKSKLVTPASDHTRITPKSILKSQISTSVRRKSKVVLFKENRRSTDEQNNQNVSNMIFFSPPVKRNRRSMQLASREDEDEENNQNSSNMMLFSPPIDTPKRRSKRLAKH